MFCKSSHAIFKLFRVDCIFAVSNKIIYFKMLLKGVLYVVMITNAYDKDKNIALYLLK